MRRDDGSVVVLIIVVIVIIVVAEQRQAGFLPHHDHDGLGVLFEHAVFLQGGDRVLDLLHQAAFAAAESADAAAGVFTEIDDADH
ncbi:MAG: hypothetical protein J0H99_01540, partial [Rhodospirillales bacterium]|nr:hypothetical protein [Rhodospirillales bacterium]